MLFVLSVFTKESSPYYMSKSPIPKVANPLEKKSILGVSVPRPYLISRLSNMIEYMLEKSQPLWNCIFRTCFAILWLSRDKPVVTGR